MKSGSFWSWCLGLGLAALPLIGGCLRTVPPPPQPTAFTEPTFIETDPGLSLSNPPDAAVQALPGTKVEEAVVKPLPAEFVLPPNVQPGKSLTDLIRLAQAGAEEGVLLAFVTNSPNTFNPRADDIVYLKDIGVSEGVVSAMLQRDEKLKAAMAGAPSAPAPLVMTGTNGVPQVPYAAAPTYTTPPAPPAPAPVEYVPESAPPPPAPVSEEYYPEFYDALAPYGSWVDVDGYGYCWQPAVVGVNPGWAPYYDGGSWVYTDCGWYWTSSYSWGWAPFHYGRWFHHNHWGWCWQPDRVWGPSWVCWRHNATHCGWAALPPGVRFSHTAGLTDPHRQVAQLSPQHFRFVEWGHFRDQNLAQHGVSREQATRVYGQTTLATHIVATHGKVSNDGLAPERVSAATHTTLTRVTLRDVQPTTSGPSRVDRMDANGRTLSVYRPQVAPAPVTHTAVSGRAPATKPLATSTTSSRTIQHFASPSTGSGAGAAALVTPPPVSTSQRAINPTRGTTAQSSQGSARFQHSPTTAQPEAVQPRPNSHLQSSPIPAYEATSRYYKPQGSTPAVHWPNTSQTRTPAATTAPREVPQPSQPAVEPPHREAPDNSFRSRVQVPAAAPAPERHSAPAVERPHHDPAPVERPSRAEPAESHASHAAPPAPSHAAPSPAPAPAPSHSSSDRSDKSDHSDSGSSSSHGRR
jgi:hypothetical protein